MMRRIVVLLAAAAAVLAVVVAGRIPVEEPGEAPVTVAEVTPAVQPIACPGPVEIPVGDIDSGDPDLGSGSEDRSYDVAGEGTDPVGAGFRADGDAAASVERIGTGDVAGLAAASCLAPVRDQWLVGGSTALGASARLVLTNPSDASSEATVTLYGGLGELEEHAVLSIAPGGQQDVLLEAVAAEVPALAVRVVATGAGVVAQLQDSRLDGFQAAGTDWVSRGASLATSLVVPGVGVSGDATATLRLLAPEGATAHLTLAGDDGAVEWGGVSALSLEPGVVTEVPVPAIASGAVQIEADAPVVAGAVLTVPRAVTDGPAGASAADLAWTPAQAVGDGAARTLMIGEHVTAIAVHAAQAGEVAFTDASGEVVASATMRAGSTRTLAVDLPAGTVVTGPAGVAWIAVLSDDPGFVATLVPRRTDVESTEVQVGQRPYVRDGS
ncbi:DUF5719 family protein [Demequina iriomotensis]|uniref:DUF5719 family protein n=1 Tax=Demequina iriomotensis TaxID=1536641 RepID=UPI000B12D49C|nr:DUF5719 family protein [Demequina iriomotensis]